MPFRWTFWSIESLLEGEAMEEGNTSQWIDVAFIDNRKNMLPYACQVNGLPDTLSCSRGELDDVLWDLLQYQTTLSVVQIFERFSEMFVGIFIPD